MTTRDAARSMREFSETVDAMIADDTRRIAKHFASLHGSHVASTTWSEYPNGDAGITVVLTDGHSLYGRGGGRLDALVDAEKDLAF